MAPRRVYRSFVRRSLPPSGYTFGVTGLCYNFRVPTSWYKSSLLVALLLVIAAEGRSEIRVLDVLSAPQTTGLPAPGSLATIYCTGLEGIQGTLVGSGVPLPTTLGGVRVTFGLVDAPLLAVKDVRAGG